ncbi:MAG: four helix bundle protein [Candidatus Pacebacteria bacterium]|nr:four helix bundle protein [Candidatus Paceibacterota bacterium]
MGEIKSMDQENIFKKTPPQGSLNFKEFPSVLNKLKETYSNWLAIHKDFPKVERLNLGRKIDELFVETLALIFSSVYLAPQEKIIYLNKAISKVDILKFFLQISWENKLILDKRYIEISSNLLEIGRQLGGWKKGLQLKTPVKTTGEKQ